MRSGRAKPKRDAAKRGSALARQDKKATRAKVSKGRHSSAICHRMWQRIEERLRSKSVRRVGPARLTRRCRPNTRTCERADQTTKVP